MLARCGAASAADDAGLIATGVRNDSFISEFRPIGIPNSENPNPEMARISGLGLCKG